MPNLSEDAIAVLLGFIGGEVGIKRLLDYFNQGYSSKMYMKGLVGALLLYLGATEGFYFIGNLGVGLIGGGAYEYLLKQGSLK